MPPLPVLIGLAMLIVPLLVFFVTLAIDLIRLEGWMGLGFLWLPTAVGLILWGLLRG